MRNILFSWSMNNCLHGLAYGELSHQSSKSKENQGFRGSFLKEKEFTFFFLQYLTISHSLPLIDRHKERK